MDPLRLYGKCWKSMWFFLFFPGRKIQYSCDSGTVALELYAGESSPGSSLLLDDLEQVMQSSAETSFEI